MNLPLVGFESFTYVALPASFLCKLILALRVLRRMYRLYVVTFLHEVGVKLILCDVISAKYYLLCSMLLCTYYAQSNASIIRAPLLVWPVAAPGVAGAAREKGAIVLH